MEVIEFLKEPARLTELGGRMIIMGTEKLVVIGGNAAGMTAATKARRLNHHLQIKVFEKGPYISYAS